MRHHQKFLGTLAVCKRLLTDFPTTSANLKRELLGIPANFPRAQPAPVTMTAFP